MDAHPGKRVDGVQGGEVQGYYVTPRSHMLGVSVSERLDILQAIRVLLFERRVVAVYRIERIVGKL